VHQHVGVEHEQLFHLGLARKYGLFGHQGGEGRRFCGGFGCVLRAIIGL
jgi:hypothetical protein